MYGKVSYFPSIVRILSLLHGMRVREKYHLSNNDNDDNGSDNGKNPDIDNENQ